MQECVNNQELFEFMFVFCVCCVQFSLGIINLLAVEKHFQPDHCQHGNM